jgi:hypothetical protein
MKPSVQIPDHSAARFLGGFLLVFLGFMAGALQSDCVARLRHEEMRRDNASLSAGILEADRHADSWLNRYAKCERHLSEARGIVESLRLSLEEASWRAGYWRRHVDSKVDLAPPAVPGVRWLENTGEPDTVPWSVGGTR